MKIILLGKPVSTNNVYRRHGNIIYMSKEGKDLKESYSLQAMSQYKNKVTERDLKITIELYFNNHLRRDIDNWHKILLDSLTGIVWKDDCQIMEMQVKKFVDKEMPRIELIVEEYKKL